ncbi:hypothetical protein ACNKHR_00600 [Shigella flexneri]
MSFSEMPLGMDEDLYGVVDGRYFHCHWHIRACLSGAGFVHEAKLHGAHTVVLNLNRVRLVMNLPRNITAGQAGGA